jgi:hypothetical protein
VAVAFAIALAIAGPRPAHAQQFSGCDTTLASGSSITLYPIFSLGGARIHSPQFVTQANGYIQAKSFSLYSWTARIRLVIYGAKGNGTIDTTGFSIPGLGNDSEALPTDSLKVWNWSGVAADITWAFRR